MSHESANYRLRFEGYSTYHKVRPSKPEVGGGVAILIKENIPHIFLTEPILNSIIEDYEIIGLCIELPNIKLNFFSYYSPPHETISNKFFDFLNNLVKNSLVYSMKFLEYYRKN